MTGRRVNRTSDVCRLGGCLRENYNGGVAAITLAIIWAAKTPVETITKKERVSAETIAKLIMDEVTMTMHAAA